MKRSRALVFVVLVALVMGFSAPLLASTVACAEDGCTDCCDLDCTRCLCCTLGPQARIGEQHRRSAGEPEGRLWTGERTRPPEPLPRDVLHVPIFLSLA